MNRRRLIRRLRQGHLQNVSFAELCDLASGFGFRCDRVTGSHQVWLHRELGLLLSLQPRGGEAKPYQLRELLKLVERYNLRLEEKR